MFEIKICSLIEAESLIRNWATRTVSLIDRAYRGRFSSGDPCIHCIMKFDDVEADIPSLGMIAPTVVDIQNVLRYTAGMTDQDRLLVHCHQGISRSTAMAISILVQYGMEPAAALESILSIRPQMWPNLTVIRLADEAMGQGGKLLYTVTEWKKTNQGKLCLPDKAKTSAEAKAEMARFMALL
jgi:predicted protein tyrosine phosphatase